MTVSLQTEDDAKTSPLDMESFIDAIPKVELHLHIEGTLEPELVFELARRNTVTLPYASETELRNAYQFENLQDFLTLYYQACAVLITKQDFYDMTMAYLKKSHKDNLVHTEIFVDPQSHTSRGISLQTVLDGIIEALQDAQRDLGITHCIIVSVLRHLDAEDAMNMLDETLEYKKEHPDAPILGLGLDSAENGNPPSRFVHVFQKARDHGLKVVAHAGEEGPPAYIHEALDLLQVDRIDHGVRCLEDPQLVERLQKMKMPLTVCPNSNVKLCVFPTMEDHNLRQLLEQNLCASIHSDDPAYFGGYIGDNYKRVVKALDMSKDEVLVLARNAIEAAFLSPEDKVALHKRLDNAIQSIGGIQ
jgi:adenosine deaminase